MSGPYQTKMLVYAWAQMDGQNPIMSRQACNSISGENNSYLELCDSNTNPGYQTQNHSHIQL